MIRYSHVSLLIPCDADSAATITATLGVQPTQVRETKGQRRRDDDSWEETTNHSWMLDSPMSHTNGNSTARLYALAETIEPFAARLPDLRPKFNPWIEILYHLTPQDVDRITGEFDWLVMPAELMRRYSAWDLEISYEWIWFDHPDRINRLRGGLWRRIIESLRRERPGHKL